LRIQTGDTKWPNYRMSNRALEYPVLVLIGFLAFFIGTWFFTGFYGSDDLSYLGAIRGIAEHGGYSPNFGGARLGLVYPGALIYKLTGGNLFATIYQTTFYFIGTTILAYFVGRVLHDGVTGLSRPFWWQPVRYFTSIPARFFQTRRWRFGWRLGFLPWPTRFPIKPDFWKTKNSRCSF